jgi:drug/metabolite transporter (DMT)-like permease
MLKLNARTALMLTLPPLLWAGNAIVGRLMVGNVPPLALNALRWVLASLLLLPLGGRVLAARGRREIAQRWPALALLSFLGVGSYNALQYLALTTSTPVNVTLIFASSPLWMMAVGALCYDVRPHGRQWLGAALSLAGVVVVLAHGSLQALARVHFVTGDLLMLVAVVAWAFYSWLLARPAPSMRGERRPHWNWAELLLVQTLFGSVFGLAGAGAEQAITHARIHWSLGVVLALLYVAVGPSLIAYRLWGAGVASVGPTIATFFANLLPLFAAVMSAALLGEPPQGYHALAFALIVGGIAVSSRR